MPRLFRHCSRTHIIQRRRAFDMRKLSLCRRLSMVLHREADLAGNKGRLSHERDEPFKWVRHYKWVRLDSVEFSVHQKIVVRGSCIPFLPMRMLLWAFLWDVSSFIFYWLIATASSQSVYTSVVESCSMVVCMFLLTLVCFYDTCLLSLRCHQHRSIARDI